MKEPFCRDRDIDTGMIGSFQWNMTTRSYISFHYGLLRRMAVGSTITISQTLIRVSLAPVLFHHPNTSLEPSVAYRQQWVSQTTVRANSLRRYGSPCWRATASTSSNTGSVEL